MKKCIYLYEKLKGGNKMVKVRYYLKDLETGIRLTKPSNIKPSEEYVSNFIEAGWRPVLVTYVED
jgi:hypothetical protein